MKTADFRVNGAEFAGNNPIRYVDPDGRSGIPFLSKLKMRQYISTKDSAHTDIYRFMSLPQNRIKENYKIDIYRSSDDNGNKGKGNDKYYKSDFVLSCNGKVIFQCMVQTTPDHPNLNDGKNEHEGGTLAAKLYTATLISDSPSYGDSFIIVQAYMVHPNKWITKKGGPWNQPFSLGCIIMKYEDYFTLLEILKADGFKFKSSADTDRDTIKLEIHN